MVDGWVLGTLATCALAWLMVEYAEVDLITFLGGWAAGVLIGRVILLGKVDHDG